MDGELQRKSAAFVDDLRRDNVPGEFELEKELAGFKVLETSPERSPRAISPLHTIEDTEVEEKEAIGADTRKRIPLERVGNLKFKDLKIIEGMLCLM